MRPVAPLLAARSSDEYEPLPLRPIDRQVGALVEAITDSATTQLGLTDTAFLAGNLGTATTLLALNEAHGEAFYDVPAEAATDQVTADAVSPAPVR